MNFVDPNNYKLLEEIQKLFPIIVLVGSRRVLGDDVSDGTDWDFMAKDTPEIRNILEKDGWVNSVPPLEVTSKIYLFSATLEAIKYINVNPYGDIASTAIYKKSDIPMQIVLKDPEYWDRCMKMWDLLERNPQYFKTRFWKSYVNSEGCKPNHRENIKERIEDLLQYVL